MCFARFEALESLALMDSTWRARIRACVIGRESIPGGSDIYIIARTDAMAVDGYDEAIKRVSGGWGSRTGWADVAADRGAGVWGGHGVPRGY